MRTNKQIIEAAKAIKESIGLRRVKDILALPVEERTDTMKLELACHTGIDSLLRRLKVLSAKNIVDLL